MLERDSPVIVITSGSRYMRLIIFTPVWLLYDLSAIQEVGIMIW